MPAPGHRYTEPSSLLLLGVGMAGLLLRASAVAPERIYLLCLQGSVGDEATEQTVRASETVKAEILKVAFAFKNSSG